MQCRFAILLCATVALMSQAAVADHRHKKEEMKEVKVHMEELPKMSAPIVNSGFITGNVASPERMYKGDRVVAPETLMNPRVLSPGSEFFGGHVHTATTLENARVGVQLQEKTTGGETMKKPEPVHIRHESDIEGGPMTFDEKVKADIFTGKEALKQETKQMKRKKEKRAGRMEEDNIESERTNELYKKQFEHAKEFEPKMKQKYGKMYGKKWETKKMYGKKWQKKMHGGYQKMGRKYFRRPTMSEREILIRPTMIRQVRENPTTSMNIGQFQQMMSPNVMVRGETPTMFRDEIYRRKPTRWTMRERLMECPERRMC